MAQIAAAVAASHAPGLVGLFDDAPEESKRVVTDAYGRIERELHDLDVVVVVANDHLANSRVRTYPDFLLGLAPEHDGPFEWFKPWIGCRDYRVAGDPQTGERLFAGLSRRGERVFATRENLRFDDNISIPVILTGLENAAAMIPILQNCTVPPIPDQRRSYEFGRALGEVIRRDLPDDLRVGLFGSGGLSHEPGGKRYFYIDEDFDTWFLGLLQEGDHERILAEVTAERMQAAGSGGTSELLAWFVVLGAIGPQPCETLGYTAYPNWKCGVGAVRWEVAIDSEHGSETTQPRAFPEGFNPGLASHDLVQDLKWDAALREEFQHNEGAVLERYPLSDEERRAIDQRDFRALYDLGFHPYLGGQLARLIYGNEAGKGATVAVQKLVESLSGEHAG